MKPMTRECRCKGEPELAPRLVEAEQRTQDRSKGGEEEAEEAVCGRLSVVPGRIRSRCLLPKVKRPEFRDAE
jgi:hypothetical protein